MHAYSEVRPIAFSGISSQNKFIALQPKHPYILIPLCSTYLGTKQYKE